MIELTRTGQRMRIWGLGEGPGGAEAGITVEWAGPQLGHPSSYGLLGGRLADAISVDPPASGCFQASLAGGADDVEFGLPYDEYRRGVEAGLRGVIEITVAAHGRAGSSEIVFRRLATVLSGLLHRGDVPPPPDIWALWDSTL